MQTDSLSAQQVPLGTTQHASAGSIMCFTVVLLVLSGSTTWIHRHKDQTPQLLLIYIHISLYKSIKASVYGLISDRDSVVLLRVCLSLVFCPSHQLAGLV